MNTKSPQSESQVRFFFDQKGEINEQRALMPWRLEKDGSAGGKPQGDEQLVILRDGQHRAWLVKVVKHRLGRDTSALCRYMWRQRGNAVGRGRLCQLEEAALSALSCCWRLKRVPSHRCWGVLKQPSRSWHGKNNLTPLILQLDQFTRERPDHPKSRTSPNPN